MDALQRHKLIHRLTVEDRRQKTNRYALALYLGALEHVEALVTTGTPIREALMTCFCGPMVNRLVKALGQAPLTPDEIKRVR